MDTPRGHNYMGTVNVTSAGIPCQRWDSDTPHIPHYNESFQFPDATLDDAANHCRNPQLVDDGPWCYTQDPDVRWQYCDIPWCSK